MTTAPRTKTVAGTIVRQPSPAPDTDEITCHDFLASSKSPQRACARSLNPP